MLQQYHKVKGHRSSGILFAFWLLITLCAIPQLRWEVINFNTCNFGNDEFSWEGFQFIVFVLFFSFSSIMLILHCFSDKPPQHSTYPKPVNPSPELKASIVNRLFFWFFDKTAWTGWRNPLTEKNIYDINPSVASSELVPEFDRNFKRSLEKQRE